MTDAILGAYDLNEEIQRYPPGETAAGRRAETLIKDDRLRVVLVTMRAGATLHEHTAPGPITIQVLGGRFGVTVAGEEREMGSGALLALASGVRHAVTAREDGSFLLTIGWAEPIPAG
ncbi:MAG: cupin domain-containing protein [Thermomicrobiales bacterium]